MASSNRTRPSLYPPVLLSNPDSYSPAAPGGASLYPTVDASDLAAEQLFPYDDGGGASSAASAPPECVEEVVLTIPGAIANLIDREYSVELAAGLFSIVRLRQGGTVLALFARVGDDMQWPLAKDEAAVKLDDSHYFFSLRVPPAAARGSPGSSDDDAPSPAAGDVLNYGLTFASKGQEKLLRELDEILEAYSSFSVQKVADGAAGEVLDASVARGVAPAEMASGPKKDMMEKQSAAYWTTLAPNVEEYSGYVARGIALGSGQLIRGIIWCGDVTVDRFNWGNEVLKKRIDPNAKKSEISRDTIKRMKRCDLYFFN